MTSFSLVDAYDPGWEQLFGEFQLIPSLKPRPIGPGQGDRQKPSSPKGSSGGAIGLINNALHTPQAVVKIVPGGGVTSAGRLGGQLAYITRQGTLTAERGETGEVLQGMDALKVVQEDWAKDWEGMDARTTNYTYHVIVSYPKGTDSYAAEVAAENFAYRLTGGEYGGQYKFVMAHHRDTDYPHTHLVINRAAQSGKTLHLSRYGVTMQDLRDLQVETARDVGITLSATSRFSRNLEPDRDKSARIHARRDGRDLRERSRPETRSGFPLHGRGRRTPIAPDQLQILKAQRNQGYEKLGATLRSHSAAVSEGVFKIQYPGRAETLGTIGKAVLGAANILLRDGVLKTRETDMNQQVANELRQDTAARVDDELKSINGDVKSFIERMTGIADATEDEGKRTKMEIALSGMLKEYEPLMDDETKSFFGKRLEHDDALEVARGDPDPVRQRQAAERDAADPTQTKSLTEDRSDDPRGAATRAVLSEADKKVVALFEDMGMNGDLALSRIQNGANVDQATRDKWFERDVDVLKETRTTKEARKDLQEAYKGAAKIYGAARTEIRSINQAFSEGRGEEYLKDKVNQAVINEIDRQDKRKLDHPEFVKDNPLDISKREHERITGRDFVPSKSDERAAPERQGTETVERTPVSTNQRPDLKDGVRGEIVVTGSALYDKEDKTSLSPYVDLKIEGSDKPYRLWGVDLPDMMERQNLHMGDTATIAHDGYKMVTVKKLDEKTGEMKDVSAKRRAWKAADIERAPREEERMRGQKSEPAQRPQQQEKVQRQEDIIETGVTGVIVDAKEALFTPDDPNSVSFHVDMKVEGRDELQRIWGTALQDQMERNNLSIGDTATFVERGKEKVTRRKPSAETDEMENVGVTRRAWDVKNIERHSDRDPEVQERLRREREERAKSDRGLSR